MWFESALQRVQIVRETCMYSRHISTYPSDANCLRDQNTGWHPNLPGTPDAVSTERCSTANIQPEALRPYHWCADESSLAACVGADRLAECCADVQSSSWPRAAVSGAIHLCGWPSQSPGSAVSCHQSLGCAICQLLAAELFRLPPAGSGILYRRMSSQQQRSSPSRNTWRRSYCNDRTH